jgi:hypothetical protein
MGDLGHRHTQHLLCRFEEGRNRIVAAMKQMNRATHRRGSDHLLPLDPDEYRWPPQRFQSQVAKIRVERQNSKVGDHHFTRAHLQFELSDPLHTGLARYKLVKPAEDRRQAARRRMSARSSRTERAISQNWIGDFGLYEPMGR